MGIIFPSPRVACALGDSAITWRMVDGHLLFILLMSDVPAEDVLLWVLLILVVPAVLLTVILYITARIAPRLKENGEEDQAKGCDEGVEQGSGRE